MAPAPGNRTKIILKPLRVFVIFIPLIKTGNMAASQNILITGGTGLIGSRLVEMLSSKGHKIAVLSRQAGPMRHAKVYRWDPGKGEIDSRAIENTDVIIHLAGAGIGEKRWTKARRREILDSRVKPVYLIAEKMKIAGVVPGVFISASGVSLYDQQDFERRNTEKSPAGNSFLAEVVKEWEHAADIFSDQGVRTVKMRTGLVLDAGGGAFPKMAAPVKMGLGAALGPGKQWIPWIHLEDICRLYAEAAENPAFRGPYNAVAPECVTNRTFMKELCRILRRPFWPVHVPAAMLKIIFGEMAAVLLEGGNCVNERIRNEIFFHYRYPALAGALESLHD